MNNLSILKDRIIGGNKEYNIIDTYHNLMVAYGYIPFKEFTEDMDAELVDELIVRINKDRERENKK